MKIILVFITLLLADDLFAQSKIIIHTDSSRIEIDTFRNQRIEEEYLNGKNLIRWTYYNEKNVIGIKAFYDTVKHYPIGVWQVFDDTGKLIRMEDYDRRTRTVFNEKLYPYKISERKDVPQ